MRAYKCDACGKVYERYLLHTSDYYYDGYEYYGTNVLSQQIKPRCDDITEREPIEKRALELCQDCCTSFNLWLESRKNSRVAKVTDIYKRASVIMQDYEERISNEDKETGCN